MTNYSLWEVIKNGNKVLRRTVGTVEQVYEPTTAEEKQDRRNEMKARATLLMALLNKDQLKFHLYQDAKLLMEAIEKRYGGNKELNKVQRTLLKQQYENFAALSSETMDQTFDRLQKLISQLEIQGESTNAPHFLKRSRTTHPVNLENRSSMGDGFADYQSKKVYQENREEALFFFLLALVVVLFLLEVSETGEQREREIIQTIAVETPTQNALDSSKMGIGGIVDVQVEEGQPTNHAIDGIYISGSSSSSDLSRFLY
ncbi:hypothetical protein Tco_0574360 [Tanacetum coccineum]